MSLSPGTTLGPYEIVSQIGAGGMGEVYKATDTRLQRTIAIKVLPEHLADDPQRLARFQREAQTVSSLNHPHICALHDVGDEAGTRFLVMEYVEGQTLGQRLESGPLPVDDALEYAKQIADALEKAHQQGIVHRDLKPGNVMITSSGIKLLDFGLAKLGGSDTERGSPLSQMPTQGDEALTEEGTILGTFRYMAPEQLEGKNVDARTDIYALCLVLYEMLTARQVFDATTQASLIAAILKDKPRPLTELQPITPPQLDRVVQTGLEKDPDKRWQSAREVKHALEWIRLEVPATASAGSRTRLGSRVAAGVAALAVAAALLLSFLVSGSPPEWRVDIWTGETTDPFGFALSPDGRQLVYVASGPNGAQLWRRPLDADNAEALDGTEGASHPFWSPDSQSIGFFAQGQLMRIDLDSRVTTRLAEAGSPYGGSWGPDGSILYVPQPSSGIFRVSENGGETARVGTSAGPAGLFPLFIDERRFLFYPITSNEIHLGDLESQESTLLLAASPRAAPHPSGYLFFVRQGVLMAQPFDRRAGVLTGEEVKVADGVITSRFGAGTGLSVSASGIVAYRRGETRRQLAWFDRSGEQVGLAGRESSDLRWPVVDSEGRVAAGNFVDGNIWLIDTDRSIPRQFTFTPEVKHAPIWSPDGEWVVFRAAGVNLRRKRSSGAGEEEVLHPDPAPQPTDWSPDGRFLLYNVEGGIGVLSMEGDVEAFVYLDDAAHLESHGVFSPDGRWVAYESNETGRSEIYVRPFPQAAGSQSKISSDGGRFARWSTDGEELYFLTAAGMLMVASVDITGEVFQYEAPEVLFPTRVAATELGDLVAPYDVGPDGRFLMFVPPAGEINPITVILNWDPDTE